MKPRRISNCPNLERCKVEASTVMAYPMALLALAEQSMGRGQDDFVTALLARAREELLSHTFEVLGRADMRVRAAEARLTAAEPRPRRLN